jgi:tetratricopeptide (TPR) repeat protein
MATTPCTKAQECSLLSKDQRTELVEPQRGESNDDIWNKPEYKDYKKGIKASRMGNFEDALIYLKKQMETTKIDQRLENKKLFSYYDLFPSRETGVIYLRKKDFLRALNYLEKSVAGYKTAKGRFYLDRARQGYVKSAKLDQSPPEMDANTDIKDKKGVTKEFWARIKGNIEDDTYITRLTINQKEIPTELSSRKVVFKKRVPLLKKQNIFQLKAEDISGKISEREIKIYNDSDAPLVTFLKHKSNRFSNFTRITFTGEINDDIQVREFFLGGESIRLGKRHLDKPGPERLAFNKDFYIFGDSREFELRIKDRLGNLIKGGFGIKISASGQARVYDPSRRVQVASLGRSWFDLFRLVNVERLLGVSKPSQKTGPRLYITNLENEQVAYMDKIFIEGHAWDPRGIRTLTIREIPQPIAVGVQVFFGMWLPLDMGENRIVFRAENKEGVVSEKTITITRKEKEFRKIDNRMTFSILPFVTRGDPTHYSDLFMELVMAYFVSDGRFRIVEREQLSHILQEQKLALSDLTERETAIQVGRLLSADAILMGTIHETADSFEVVSWLADVETSEILESKEEYTEKISLKAIRRMAQSLMYKYHQAFPLLEGVVLNREEQTIYEDLGSKMGVKTGRKFVVFRDKGPIVLPKTGLILGHDYKLLGVVRVSEVFKESSKSRIIREIEPDLIESNDRIIAK